MKILAKHQQDSVSFPRSSGVLLDVVESRTDFTTARGTRPVFMLAARIPRTVGLPREKCPEEVCYCADAVHGVEEACQT